MQLLVLVHGVIIGAALLAILLTLIADGIDIMRCPNKYVRMGKKRRLLKGVVMYMQLMAGTSAFFGVVAALLWATGGAV